MKLIKYRLYLSPLLGEHHTVNFLVIFDVSVVIWSELT